jgi:hypothetical protein
MQKEKDKLYKLIAMMRSYLDRFDKDYEELKSKGALGFSQNCKDVSEVSDEG